MITTYVNLRSELTAEMIKQYKDNNNVYRTRLACGCMAPKNTRYGIIVIDANHVEVAQIIKCKGCFNALTEGGNK